MELRTTLTVAITTLWILDIIKLIPSTYRKNRPKEIKFPQMRTAELLVLWAQGWGHCHAAPRPLHIPSSSPRLSTPPLNQCCCVLYQTSYVSLPDSLHPAFCFTKLSCMDSYINENQFLLRDPSPEWGPPLILLGLEVVTTQLWVLQYSLWFCYTLPTSLYFLLH